MVKGSDKTYGQLMQEARSITDNQSVDDTVQPVMKRFEEIIEDAVQKNYDNGVRGKYYIHLWVTKEPYTQNALHLYPQCRRTRPSPYQGNDHYLWSILDGGVCNFEWCIPKKEILNYILANPTEFDPSYVAMLRKYVGDKIEKLEDYLVKGKIQ
jgi:hypothetical protein